MTDIAFVRTLARHRVLRCAGMDDRHFWVSRLGVLGQVRKIEKKEIHKRRWARLEPVLLGVETP
ncbi:MAG: hypothetical protein ACYTBJ_01725 [Planctomycetota bacterium]|jgi:hypothetical protein